ncbi:hypothetical protein XF_1023 [Xylella fastidiosa 9a5c]|uniref:Uncharacterized protein n=1 Tax=Xylella fastidiosa (strain 9a5c) TaxID=160492 RepID=Q9PEK5_XYLFA|nr:hypothetical protein XF_1023 [Xylella fastidiosa 9a5c]
MGDSRRCDLQRYSRLIKIAFIVWQSGHGTWFAKQMRGTSNSILNGKFC